MATASHDNISPLITKSPEVRDGRPVIAGTGMMVRTLAGLYIEGATPEEIAERKYLTLAQVYAALAYYRANRSEIENDMTAYDREYESLEMEWRKTHLEESA